jgi:hypothetical protein
MGIKRGRFPRLALVLSASLCVTVIGCGKTGSTTVTRTVTTPAPTQPASTGQSRATLTRAQAIATGDAICARAIRKSLPMVIEVERIEKSSAGKHEINLRRAPTMERIAGQTRETSRQLELEVTIHAANQMMTNYKSSLLELAIVEEQLSQASREEEKARIAPITANIQSIRAHARAQAKEAGFHVCSATTRTAVG